MANAGGLTDREAAIDAIFRFVNSLDEGDADLCASALTEDMELDLTPFQATGRNYQQPITGREAVVELLMSVVGKALDTTHMVTNLRCTVDGDNAELTACALAQHFRKGAGPSPEFQECYANGNKYESSIVRDGEVWKVKKLRITPLWTLGNPDVMKDGEKGASRMVERQG